jgi:hypothetical protein
VFDRIGDPSVLGLGLVVEIDQAALVGDHVLKQGVAFDGPENFRLAVGREVDALGVATPLEVEDAVVVPAVLVIADQLAGRVGRQGGLAGAFLAGFAAFSGAAFFAAGLC